MIMFGCAMSILRAQHVRAVGELTRLHAAQQVEILVDRTIAIRAVGARRRHRAALLADLLVGLRIDVGLALLHQQLAEVVQLLEVVARVQLVVPLEAEPLDVVLDRLDVLDVFGRPDSCRRTGGCSVPPNSFAMPKLTQIDLTWPMCGNPFGSGGKRVAIWRPNRLLATSSATISRMKSRRGAGVG